MSAVISTSIVPFAGVVELISGAIASPVVNENGFGTAPAARSFPAVSFPPVILNV